MFFAYRFNKLRLPLRLIGVRAASDGVTIDDQRVFASFGPFTTVFDLANIKSATVTGPYKWYKAIGPRLSAADHGLTFGTTIAEGVCIEFHRPIPPVLGPWKHPGLTVTVANPAELASMLSTQQ